MVFFFVSRGPEKYMIYMGRDKFENEELIAYGFHEDIWFHVDDLSSAHVYLRLPAGKTIHDISPGLLEDCTQLVKHNSIEGCKLNTVSVVYTPWSNLKKTAGMDVGQVGFHDESQVIKYKVPKKLPAVVKTLNNTKEEKEVDLQGLQAKRLAEIRRDEKKAREQNRKQELAEAEQHRKEKEQKNYVGFMDESKMQSNQLGNAEEDFW